MRATAFLAVAPLLLVPAMPAGAQDVFDEDRCIELFQELAAAQAADLRPGVMEAEKRRAPLGAGDTGPNLETAASLRAGDDNGRAFLRLANKVADVGETSWALQVSAPFDDKKGEGVIASRAGVSGDIRFTASMARYGWDLEPMAYGRELCRQCRQAGARSLQDCLPENRDLFTVEQTESLQDALFGKVAAVMWGFEGAVGRKERKYFDTAGEQQAEDRMGLSFSVLGGLHLTSASIFGKLTGKTDYDEGDAVQKCTPVEDAVGLESCKELPFGRAEETNGLIGSLQYVRPFRRVAVAPEAELDFEESEWTLRLPIYLVRNADDAWVAGLQLAWTSDDAVEEDFGAAIFISKPLEF